MHLEFRILSQQLYSVRRKAGGQRRDIDPTRAKFGLQSIGVGNHSDPHYRDMRRAIPVIRIRLKIKHLLRIVITDKLKRSAAERMILLCRVAVLGNNGNRNKIAQ